MFIFIVVCFVFVVDCLEDVGIVEMIEVSYYNCVICICLFKVFFVFIRRIDIYFFLGFVL